MRTYILAMLTGISLTVLFFPAAWALDEEVQAAKEEGMRLYGIRKADSAIPFLEQAAEAGDVEAMYYLGEANRRLVMGNMNQAALDWYYLAAQQGEPYAMLRLHSSQACQLGDMCPENSNDWLGTALAATLPKAEAGDAAAMFALYSIYASLEDVEASGEWLLEAAEAGNVEAQTWLGRKIRSGASDIEAQEAAAKWFRRAAEEGYAPSMSYLAATLNSLGDSLEAWEWMVKASEAGNISGRQWLASCYIDPTESELCHVEQEPAKGWAIFLAIQEEVSGTSSERALRVYRDSLTPEQRTEGERMKDDWLGLEPPLSYFPERFGP
ncbi:tetratricopeptide repeat protein [Vreelandella sulfidaeris]|uniref:tetratricopeptide repeat protein n=1 Tax=Vreelandella sulfidaeris TaxID=115553 RepID=UPI0035EDE029